jgi:hypothetical protein
MVSMLGMAVTAGACHRATVEPSRAPVAIPSFVPSAPPAPPAPAPGVAASPPEEATPAPPAPPQVYDVRTASRRYDFRLTVASDAEQTDGTGWCRSPGQLAVSRKGGDAPLQSLLLESVCVVLDDAGRVLANSARMYDAQGTIQVGDFNFDGQEDFAVQDSESGPYGGPTYAVYLYSRREGLFVLSDELSELTQATLGMFQVDTARRRLVTSAKSGCCFHATEEFEVVRDQPELRARHTEAVEPAGDRLVITDEHLIKGTWRTRSRTVPIDADGSPRQ